MPMMICRPAAPLLPLAALLLACGLAAPAQAKPLMVDGLLAHRVTPGDTLEQIARQYMGDHRLWPELQSFNRVANPRHLQPGFTLRFPDRLLRLATASVEYVRGQAVALTPAPRGDGQAPGAAQRRNVQAGEVLQEGEQLQLAANSFVSVRLADGSLVRVQAQSEVQLQQMRRRGRAGSLQSVLELQSGALDASVTRDSSSQRRFEIRTPVASTSVRGTRFNVQTDASGRTMAAVDEGSVAVASAAATPRANARRESLLVAGQGLAVSADAAVGAPSTLLPAPDLATLPERFDDAHWLDIGWPAIAGARRYQLQVARDAQFSQVVRSAMSDTAQVRLEALDDGDYFLALRAIDAQGLPGRLAQRSIRIKSQPVPPLYQTPVAGGVIAQGAGALQCTSVPGAIAYRIQVAGAGGFTHALLDSRVDGECRLSAAALPAGAYQWRAASIRSTPTDAADQGPFAAGQAFSVATPPPALAADALDFGAEDGTTQLSWPGAPGQSYRLVVASDPAFKAVQHDAVLQEPRWAASTLPPGRYYVQLQVIDSNGLRSRFSPAREFTAGNTVRDGSGQSLRTGADLPLQRQ